MSYPWNSFAGGAPGRPVERRLPGKNPRGLRPPFRDGAVRRPFDEPLIRTDTDSGCRSSRTASRGQGLRPD